MRDPRTGRFIAAPALPLSGRAADMLASFNEGREAGRNERYPWWGWVGLGTVIDAVWQFAIRAVWP